MASTLRDIWDGNPNDDSKSDHKPPRPFFTVKNKSEDQILSWLKNSFEFCREFYKPYHKSIQANVSLYQGTLYEQGSSRKDYDDRTARPELDKGNFPTDEGNFTNYAHELTEEIVSSITTYRPSIATYPANSDEPQDILNSITVKQLLDTIMYDTSWEVSVPQIVRNVKIAGECWQFITWDKNKGDILPAAKDAQSLGMEKIPLVDESGEQAKEDGKELYVESPPRMGDVCIEYVLAEQVLPEPTIFGNEPNWVMRIGYKHVDEIKALYKEKATKVEPDKGNHWDPAINQMNDYGNIATVITFYHKDTQFCPGGYEAVFTTEALLEYGKLSYRHGELPCEKLTDLDIPGVTRGISYFRNTANLQKMINHLHAMVRRNMELFSHPKWLVEIGSVNKKHLRRMPGIIPLVPGTNPPKLIQFQSTHNEIYQYIENMKNEIRVHSGVHPISQGVVPTGLESGIAISLLREEENKRMHSFITKYNNWIIRVWRKVLSVVSEKYTMEDKRLIRVVGKNNEYIYKVFNKTILESPYDVRLQNQSALGDTKAARVSGLMELYGKGVISPDELRDNLELGNISKVYRESMEPVQTALWENEIMLKGGDPPVEELDHHEKHYLTHYPIFQQQSTRAMVEEKKGSLIADSENLGKGPVGHLLNHVEFMVEEIKFEMAVMGQSPKMMKYGQMPGFALLARKFMAPEDLLPPAPASPSGNVSGGPQSGQAGSGGDAGVLASDAQMSAMPQESMQAMIETQAPQSP